MEFDVPSLPAHDPIHGFSGKGGLNKIQVSSRVYTVDSAKQVCCSWTEGMQRLMQEVSPRATGAPSSSADR